MRFYETTALSKDELEKKLETSTGKGLTKNEATIRHKKFGPNSIEEKTNRWYHIFIRQFKSSFIYLLIAASAIAFALKEIIDGSMIIFFVGVNVLLGFYQEYKSEQTIKALKKLMVKKARVIRDGEEDLIDTKNLVPGDLVIIETGDIVPADLRLIKCENLTIDESSLTGESKQITKQSAPILEKVTEHYKALNIAFSGTTVIEGQAYGIVISTGKDSEFGKIAKLSMETGSNSMFEKQISSFSKFTVFLTIITVSLVFAVHLVFKQTVSIGDLIIFSIALAVGVIPEGMPLVTTFSLSKAASMLSKKHVVVKRLTAIEDMGGIQVLCTDKTGTLTENILQVDEIYSHDKAETIFMGILGKNNSVERTTNNAFDIALLEKATKEQKSLCVNIKKLFEIPFNPERKKSSVLMQVEGKKILIVKGAEEAILPFVKGLTKEEDAKIIQWILQKGKEGKRIIAIAKKELDQDSYTIHDEKDLTFLGLISFVDPIKSTTLKAVEDAEKLGVKLKILTGDSLEVATSVAFATGIAKDNSEIITGNDFFNLSQEMQEEKLETISVFARVSPEHKFKIIKMLQEKQEVGYLGDGINDAPALKIAGVAIVVNTAADVSKEVADIVLLKKDLKVIIDGIKMGRKTYMNVTNYIKTTLSSNFGNFYALAFATLIIDYLPMLPIQILLLNLLSDFPMISIATDNVEREELMRPKNYEAKNVIILATLLGLVSTVFDFVVFSIFSKGSAESLRTYWFIASVLTELVLIYSIRTRAVFYKALSRPSIQVAVLTVSAVVASIAIPFIKSSRDIFGFIVPSFGNLGLILGIVVTYFGTTELVKRYYYRNLYK
jgi:Mg2+-importing ATPase